MRIDISESHTGLLAIGTEAEPLPRPNGRKERRYNVACSCGKKFIALMSNLRSGNTSSCGCAKADAARAIGLSNRTHGDTVGLIKAVEYAVWNGIIFRCENDKAKMWRHYGGRGIKICSRWRHGEHGISGYECFLADVGRRPSPKHSIDRWPDNNGNYEPTNCRWATRSQQERNKRRSA